MTMLRPEWIGFETILQVTELREDVAVVVNEYMFGQFRVQLWTYDGLGTYPTISAPEC